MTPLPASSIKAGQRVWLHFIGPWLDVHMAMSTTYNGKPAVRLDGEQQGEGRVEIHVGDDHVCWTE